MMFRLCALLGVLHPDHLGEVLTEQQIAEWSAFDEVEPFGEPRADMRAALVAWANVQPGNKKKIKMGDLVLKFGPPPPPPTPQQFAAKLRARAERHKKS